jgi:hypothetical protein
MDTLLSEMQGYGSSNSGLAMTTGVLGGTEDSNLINSSINYDTGSLSNFLLSVEP